MLEPVGIPGEAGIWFTVTDAMSAIKIVLASLILVANTLYEVFTEGDTLNCMAVPVPGTGLPVFVPELVCSWYEIPDWLPSCCIVAVFPRQMV